MSAREKKKKFIVTSNDQKRERFLIIDVFQLLDHVRFELIVKQMTTFSNLEINSILIILFIFRFRQIEIHQNSHWNNSNICRNIIIFFLFLSI